MDITEVGRLVRCVYVVCEVHHTPTSVSKFVKNLDKDPVRLSEVPLVS